MSRNHKLNRLDPKVVDILSEIQTSDAALVKALDIVFCGQEMDERAIRRSIYINAKGFAAPHGKVMADIAFYLYELGHLTDDHKRWLRGSWVVGGRPRIGIYWRQIASNWDTWVR